MSFWEVFWGIVILFSLISFIYMSIKILYFGIFELKEMFTNLVAEYNSSKELDNIDE